MLLALVMAQVGAAQMKPADSAYATEAVRSVVQAAAIANREAPPALNAYQAHLETEIGLLIVDTLGRERTGQVEQLGSTATWSRDSGYDAHVIGYRTQSAGGFPISMVGLIKGWSLPMLYGERLLIGIEGSRDSSGILTRRGNRRDTLIVVHPFAADRDQYYRYSGGDTVAVLTAAKRRVSLVRIRVIPNLSAKTVFAAFDGEIDIDADRHAIVRMRGQFVVSKEPEPPMAARLLIKATGTVGVAYAEYVNAEYDEQYWLPVTQRIEFQARIAMFGDMRSVVRIISRFSSFAIDDTTQTTSDTPRAAYTRRRVTFAPSDSMSAYDGWLTQLGTATSSVAADDFEDIAPPAWKGEGPSQFTFYPSRPDRIAHYDRIEGLFTGAELSLEMRGAAPGVVGRAHGGWAWTEQTARGGLSVIQAGKTSRTELQLDRSLATTGDFQNDLLDGGSSFGAFLASVEDEDYVDRWNASVAHTRIIGSIDHAFATVRLGLDRDVDVPESLTHGPILRSVLFRPNRHAATGSYGLGAIDYEFHPNVSGDFLEPGVGATLHVEVAAGQLSWVRTVATLSARDYVGPITVSARIRGGALFSGTPPPQTLFELGGGGGLSGYTYKEFAGDRAAIFRSYALYGFPLLRAPHKVRWFLIPGLSPGLTAGFDGAWTGISNDAAAQAVLARGDGTAANALSHATGRVRAAASIGLTFFAHSVTVGVARPIDQPARWRWVVGVGQGA
jgi:hypothetical protein